MKLEVEVKYNIGDKVLVKNPHSGMYFNPKPFIALIGGYVITKNKKSTTVRYTLEPCDPTGCTTSISDWNHKKRYGVNELERVND